MDRCAVGQRPEAPVCPACGDAVASGAMEAHVQKCLQRFSKAPRAPSTDACVCVVCRKDITALDEARRLAHVNRCLDGEAEEPLQEPVVSTPSRNGATGFVLLDCPLCERSFKTSEACKNHIKQCSTKLGMSPKQVIEAIRLQQRYVQERMAAGLPVVRRRRNVPMDASTAQRPAKKPRPVASVPKSKYQEEVQMARALSASLSSAASKEQQEAQRRFCELFGGSHSAARKRKQAIKETPVLLLTSAEERAQRVEEKIERLLTQRMLGLELGDLSWCTKLKTVGKLSDRIRELSTKDAPLWSLAGQQRECQEDYYVGSLCHVVTPTTVAVGSRLKSLTQVPGRRLSGDLGIVSDLAATKPRSSLVDGTDDKQLTTQAHRDGLLSALNAALPPTRACLDDTQLEGGAGTEAGHGFLTQENEESMAKPASLVAPAAKQLVQDLDSLVGYRRFSDIRIIAEDGCVIPAHRVILLTRCPAVEKEVSRQGDRVLLLDWTARSRACVLAFLHYVYSGALNLDSEDRRLHLELRGMAFRYNMTELCEELKDRYFRSEHEQGDDSGDEADTSLHEIITSFWDDGGVEVGPKKEPAEDDDNVDSLEEVCEFLSSQHSQKNKGAGSCKTEDEQMDEDSVMPLSRPSLEPTDRPPSRTQLDQGSMNEGGGLASLQPERKRPGTPYRVPLPVSPIQSEEEHAWTDAGSKEGDHHAFNQEEEESREAYHLGSGAGSAHGGNDSSSEELFGESGNSQASVDNSADEEEEYEPGGRGASPLHESERGGKYEEALSPNEEGSRGSGEKCKDTDDVWDCVWDGFDDAGGGQGPAPKLNASSAPERQGRPTEHSSESFTGVQAAGVEEEMPQEMLDSFFFEEQTGSGAAAVHGSQAQSPWPMTGQSPAAGSSGRFLAPVTPLPDYAAMQTPELRDQLQRFGVRRLPRTRAVNVLNRIYDETHPLVPETPPRPPVSSRQEVNAGDGREYRKEQSARSGPSEWFPGSGSADEEPYRYHVSSSSGEDGGSDSSDAGIKEQLGNFFKRNTELLESVLTYEPIDFQKLRLSLKEASIRISSKSLINYLDEQCITFTMPRSEKQQAKQRKRQQNFRRRLLAKQGPSGSAQHSSSSP
ncbi:mutagen-sensitive 312 isoform X1 [Haemaphysalis longicornis]